MKRININISDENIRKIETAAFAIAMWALSSYAWYKVGKMRGAQDNLEIRLFLMNGSGAQEIGGLK